MTGYALFWFSEGFGYEKRIVCLITMLCILTGLVGNFSTTAFAETSGTCGDNLTWTLDDEGTLTISGTGDMYFWNGSAKDIPWYNSRSRIKSVVISNGATSIGYGAFFYCTSLTSVTIPNSVTSIGNSAFRDCMRLTSITIPGSVTSIGNSAFGGCTNLTSITIPGSVTNIGSFAFEDCTSLTSITIPNSVTSIGNSAFGGCTGLKSVTLGECVKMIGDDAFRGCTNLTSITIPGSVTSIGYSAFEYCDSLTNIYVSLLNTAYSSMNGVLFNKNKTTLVCYPAGKSESSYSIPNSVTSIWDNAFYKCTSLTNITIPNGVKDIGNHAFSCCWNLTSVTLGNSVTSIGDNAFVSCERLTSIEIPNSVKNIGNHAFSCCWNLKSVTLGNSVTSIGNNAFYSCESLKSIEIPNSVKFIGGGMFRDCTELTSVTLGNSVTIIWNYMFYHCEKLTNIEIPNSVTSIKSDAFSGCYNLTDVYYGGSEEDWEKIDIGQWNKELTNATIHYLSKNKNDMGVFLQNTNKNGTSSDVSKFKIDSTYPTNKADNVPSTFDLRLNFNQSIKSANSDKKVKIIKSNGDVYKNMSADDGNISGNTITFSDISLPQGNTYSVVVDSGAYTSDFGNVFYGLQKGTFSFAVPPATENHKVKLDYPGKYVFGFFGKNTDVPPIPKGSNGDYAEELQDWAMAYGINSIASYANAHELLEIPVKHPVTDTKGQTFLLDDGGTTVKQVMNDLIFIESLKPYVQKMNVELKNLKLTDVSENLAGYDDEKALYNDKVVPYADSINEYLDNRSKKSSFFLSAATPLAYTAILKVGTKFTENILGENESMFVKAIADATIDDISIKHELNTVTGTKDYKTFKDNLSDIKSIASSGKELYKIKTSGFSTSTSKLAIDLFDTYYKGENETFKMISDARSSMDDIISCTKMSAFLGTSLGFMPMVVDLNRDLQKSLSDKIKAWFFIGDYYIKDKYPNIYNYYFTDGGYEINKDFIGMEWETVSATSAIGAEAAREYRRCKNENDTLAVSWCDFADRTGAVKMRSSELLGVKRDLVNFGTIMKFVDTVDVEKTKKCLLNYISAMINKTKTSEFYGMCPIVVNVYDKNDNLLASLSSENENDIESEYGSFYILGDNNETKYFIAASDEYRVEISAYDAGEMSVATVERDKFGNVVNTGYFKDVPLMKNSRFSLFSVPDAKTVLINSETEEDEAESVNLPENIRLSCNTNEVAVGESLKIKANIFPDFSQYDSVKWQVVDETGNETSDATVTDGVFAASTEGKYIIRAFVNENVYDEITIEAYRPITQIFCKYETLTMMTGEEKTIDLTTNADASDGRVIKKTSSNPSVAIVGEDGTITAIGKGETTIKYSADNAELLLPIIVYDTPVEISFYQSDTDGIRFKIDAMNTSCQNSFVGTATINVLKNNELLETNTVDLTLDVGQVYSGFVKLDYLTNSNNCYDVETTIYDDSGSQIYKTTDIINGLDYIATMHIDDDTAVQMSYAEFNEYTPAPREGYTFVGWYQDSSYECSSKVEKLTSAYGEKITLYGLWVSNKDLVKANVSKSYSDEELIVDIGFDSSYIGGNVTADIFKNADDTTPIKSVTAQFAAYDTELKINIPFVGDDEEYILKVSFYDNPTNKNELAETVETTFVAESREYVYNDFYYRLNQDGTAKITGYRYSCDSLRIPITLNGYKVTKIADSAFENFDFENVLIPDTITEIGDYTFKNCDYLETVNYVGTDEQWKAITIGSGNNALKKADKIFNYSENIVSGCFEEVGFNGYAVEGTIKFDYVYKNCIAVIEIINYDDEIVKTVEIEIPVGTKEKDFSIPFIADDEDYDILVSFVNNATDKIEYGEEDWYRFFAERLRKVDGDWTYAVVGENAEVLEYRGENKEIVIPDTLGGYPVTRIGSYAFGNSCLSAISIPNSVTYIGGSAFAGTAINEISIPASVTEIADCAFDYCCELAKITVDENNKNYCSDDGNLYSKDKTELVRYAPGKTAENWTIPDTVTTVKAGALTDSECLTSVTIPNGLTKIEEYAFAYGLWETLTIPESVTQIDKAAFVFCQNLTEIKVDSGNKNYCDDNGVLFNKDKTILLQYPTGKQNSFYKLPNTVKTILQESFARSLLQTIALPTSLEVVEMAAFDGCNSLDTVLYAGTVDEYLEIDFTYHNNVLPNANITFGYDGMPASIGNVKCWYDNNKVTAKIKFNYLGQAGRLYLAVYDEDKLVTLTDKPVAVDDTESTIEIINADETYKDYDVKVFCWDDKSSLKPLARFAQTKIEDAVLIDEVLESEHPYANNIDETKTYVYNGECVSIDVMFSDDTMTEKGWDYIYIYDFDDNQIGKYSGTELAGKTITVPGNTVKIRLTGDGSNAEYGYKTDNIIINK